MVTNLKYISPEIVRAFIESKNTTAQEIESIDVVVFPEHITAYVYYSGNYGRCTFHFTDYTISKVHGSHPGFADRDIQEFIILELLKNGEIIDEHCSKAEDYIDQLAMEENRRHIERLNELGEFYKIAGGNAAVDSADENYASDDCGDDVDGGIGSGV